MREFLASLSFEFYLKLGRLVIAAKLEPSSTALERQAAEEATTEAQAEV